MVFVTSGTERFCLARECFSPVVQQLALHLYTPALCTGFIGNSCAFSLMSIKALYSSGNLVAGTTLLGSSGKMCTRAFEQCLLWISCTQCHLMWQSSEFLFPQVKVSFHTTLELLTYQHLPDTQMLPGFQVLQFENGERKLKFSQNLVIEYSNHSTQVRGGWQHWAVLSASWIQNKRALGFTELWNTATSGVNL